MKEWTCLEPSGFKYTLNYICTYLFCWLRHLHHHQPSNKHIFKDVCISLLFFSMPIESFWWRNGQVLCPRASLSLNIPSNQFVYLFFDANWEFCWKDWTGPVPSGFKYTCLQIDLCIFVSNYTFKLICMFFSSMSIESFFFKEWSRQVRCPRASNPRSLCSLTWSCLC